MSWGTLLKRTFTETMADDVLNLAAQQAYYFFFALFPAILAMISLASFFPVENGGDAAILYCFVFLHIFFAGPGAWSLDARRSAALA